MSSVPDFDRILAIDPGPVVSAWVLYDVKTGAVVGKGIEDNIAVCDQIDKQGKAAITARKFTALVVEMPQCFGMPVGRSILETCYWVGYFMAVASLHGYRYYTFKLPRSEVKKRICHSMRAKDSTIRQAIIDRYGGKEKAIGTKKNQGPLYGLKKDMWQALALALAAKDWLDEYGNSTGKGVEE